MDGISTGRAYTELHDYRPTTTNNLTMTTSGASHPR